ncbi:tyrosine-type recombinase/integrase [Salinibacterium hongtaonis]|uniref:Integrase n=1 Tax=Homoserinimonas hongtaonis TaxID=2079791 RepID=A0A2U1T2V2_9MICO|nr:tyrosine-type recombinase/integrase [Salinibacterium hongtaonis]PWB98187.1 hypothetical protein DF220_10365 [Salinibacterium hongtaonis]
MARAVQVKTDEGWAVVDSRGVPIREVTPFLRHLAAVEMSPNTVRGYAFDLAHFYSFLHVEGRMWTSVNNETLGKFIKYMRTPSQALVRPSNPEGRRATASVNRAMAAVVSFARFLHDITNDQVYLVLLRSARARKNRQSEHGEMIPIVGPRLREARPTLNVLDDLAIARVIDATSNLRDRFLLSLLDETGMRIGQALLLRHSDIGIPRASIRIAKCDASGLPTEARNKSYNFAVIPVSAGLIRLYAAYMHSEYKYLDSDFVFVNLWAGSYGKPLSYRSVEQLVGRLQKKTGVVGWSAHTFRHSFVTRLLSRGVPIETVSYLVNHSSLQTTLGIYSHLDVDTVRQQLIGAGAWDRG